MYRIIFRQTESLKSFFFGDSAKVPRCVYFEKKEMLLLNDFEMQAKIMSMRMPLVREKKKMQMNQLYKKSN